MPEVMFYFSSHVSASDFEGMRNAFEEADVYFSEAHGWKQEDAEYLNAISEGTKTPPHMQEGRVAKTALELEEELLFCSHKPVYFVDIPSGHELEDADDGMETLKRAAEEFVYRTFELAEQQTLSAAKKTALFLNRKDKYIADKIREDLPKIIRENPTLKEKNKVTALVQMGASHSPIRHHAPREFVASSAEKSTLVFGFEDELIRRYRFEKEIQPDLPAKAVFEHLLREEFADEIERAPDQLFVLGLRDLLKSISREQLQQVSFWVVYRMTSRDDADEKDVIKEVVKRLLQIDLGDFFEGINSGSENKRTE